MSEANVVSLADIRAAKRPEGEYFLIYTCAFPNRPLNKGDLIAFSFGDDPHVLFSRWRGPTGKGEHGRFIRAGDRTEQILLDIGMTYSAASLSRGTLRILGKLQGAAIKGRGVLTPAGQT